LSNFGLTKKHKKNDSGDFFRLHFLDQRLSCPLNPITNNFLTNLPRSKLKVAKLISHINKGNQNLKENLFIDQLRVIIDIESVGSYNKFIKDIRI